MVVVDRSTGDSLAVARALAAEHPAVRLVAQEANQGPIATFNRGLDFVSGEFLIRLDADDMLTPRSVGRAAALARRYPSVGRVYGHPLHFTDEPPSPRSRVRSWTAWPGRHRLADRCRDGLNVITSPELRMRTSAVERLGGHKPLAYTHDIEMWLRISAAEIVAEVTGASTTLAPGGGEADTRSYRVDCSKLARVLPEAKPRWTVKRGATSSRAPTRSGV